MGRTYQAVILDLDGVITRTARLHAQAWQQMFNAFLQQRSQLTQQDYAPFDPQQDYLRYVDGKPRYDGVRSFLASRDIDLPEGNAEDGPEQQTVCGLGNRKNGIFLELVRSQGVQTYADTVAQVQRWRQQGVKTAVISSSRNCAAILEEAGLTDLFDVRVDGVDSQRLQLPGKPAPDIFLQAAQELGVSPQQAVVIEDALAGVEAGQAGQFGLVVGVVRNGDGDDLKAHGADRVVADLEQLADVPMAAAPQPRSALDSLDTIAQRLRQGTPVLFTDYDGTLTPIVERPEAAVLSEQMRSHLQALAQTMTVAVVSGRDLEDVRQRVSLPNLYYAGSHGFDIAGPNGLSQQQPAAQDALPELDQAQQQLQDQLASMEGVQVERKRFAIAIHYRRAPEGTENQLQPLIEALQQQQPHLRCSRGKKIFELQPDIPWDKGRAIRWLLQQLPLQSPLVPLYLGDDTTDEDAFRALNQAEPPGITLRVGLASEPTAARYYLPDPAAVEEFFRALRALAPQLTQTHADTGA